MAASIPRVVLFLILSLLNFSSSLATEDNRIDLVASWTLNARDDQFYSLTQEKISNHNFYFIQYGRGQRTLKVSIVDEKKWLQLRNMLTALVSSSLGKKNCTSPLSYAQKVQGQPLKTTSICPTHFSKNEKRTVTHWLKTLNEVLYSP
ncbi:MAG: hypothetical protein JNL11_03570 [Bdellovibrionaceae bacterium]|nr:hypothetical protein [Pseudobdellovibrionaceae bacterium]